MKNVKITSKALAKACILQILVDIKFYTAVINVHAFDEMINILYIMDIYLGIYIYK